MGDDEKRLIRSQFPKIDFGNVLILEDGREPTSVGTSIGIVVGGGVLILLGLLLVFRRRRGRGRLPADPTAAAHTQADAPDPDSAPAGE